MFFHRLQSFALPYATEGSRCQGRAPLALFDHPLTFCQPSPSAAVCCLPSSKHSTHHFLDVCPLGFALSPQQDDQGREGQDAATLAQTGANETCWANGSK